MAAKPLWAESVCEEEKGRGIGEKGAGFIPAP